MSENTGVDLDLDALLDGTLDDLADAPSFKPFPAGAHMVKINWNAKDTINNIPTVKLKLTHISTEEQPNPEDTPAVPGDETEVAFMLQKKNDSGKMVKNELAEGQWKEILASLKTGLGIESATNREVMAASEGLEVLAITTVRVNKKDPQDIKYYTGVKSISVV